MNYKKISLIVKAEAYRQKGYRKDAFVHSYFKKDYCGLERLRVLIWLTVFYAMYIIYVAFREFYVYKADLLSYDYQGFVIKNLLIYLGLAFVLGALSSLFAGARYDAAKERIEKYRDLVDEINQISKEEQEA